MSRFAADENVLGIGVGPKEKGGVATGEMALKFFVRRKLPERNAPVTVSKAEMLPKSVPVGGKKVVTDVVQMAPLRARGPFVQRVRPAIGGCSGCVVVPGLTYTGTLGLGMRGFAGLADRTFVLSNNHVLANENRASVGDAVIQPGELDGGDPAADRIGVLFDFVRLQFVAAMTTPNPPVNTVDAACALLDRFGDFTREIFWVGYPTGWRSRANVEAAVAAGDTKVQKTGRTTGYTTGTISAVSFDGWVEYDSGFALFEDQMLIVPGTFSDSGDSGSCILDLDERIVGLLFAGGATHTIANFIEDVWNLLPPIDFSDGRLT